MMARVKRGEIRWYTFALPDKRRFLLRVRADPPEGSQYRSVSESVSLLER